MNTFYKFQIMSDETNFPNVISAYHQYEYYEVIADDENDPKDIQLVATLDPVIEQRVDEPLIQYFRIVPVYPRDMEGKRVVYLPPGTIVKFSTGARSKRK